MIPLLLQNKPPTQEGREDDELADLHLRPESVSVEYHVHTYMYMYMYISYIYMYMCRSVSRFIVNQLFAILE